MNLKTVGPIDPSFNEEIRRLSGQDTGLCYQCWKCTTGCPLAEEMDLAPTQVVHAIRLGHRDRVLESKTIWVCTSCETCSTRCPQDVDVARLMDAARSIVMDNGLPAAVPEVQAFYRSVLGSVRTFGRLYEIGMMAALKLRTADFTKDMGLAVQIIRKRKIKLTPRLSNAPAARRILARTHGSKRVSS